MHRQCCMDGASVPGQGMRAEARPFPSQEMVEQDIHDDSCKTVWHPLHRGADFLQSGVRISEHIQMPVQSYTDLHSRGKTRQISATHEVTTDLSGDQVVILESEQGMGQKVHCA